MSKLESYKVATVDRGYHVYVAVWEAAVGQILPCKREGGNIHDPYAVAVVENNDTPIDNDAAVLNENIRGQNFREMFRNCEIRESFHQ